MVAYEALGAHVAGALVARDHRDDGPDGDRRFDVVVAHDRDWCSPWRAPAGPAS